MGRMGPMGPIPLEGHRSHPSHTPHPSHCPIAHCPMALLPLHPTTPFALAFHPIALFPCEIADRLTKMMARRIVD